MAAPTAIRTKYAKDLAMANLPQVRGLLEVTPCQQVNEPGRRRTELVVVQSPEGQHDPEFSSTLQRRSDMVYLQLIDDGTISHEVMLQPSTNKVSRARTVSQQDERERAAFNAHIFSLIAKTRARNGQSKSRKARG